MSENGKTYWKGLAERDAAAELTAQAANEFAEELPVGPERMRGMDRRSFLRLTGFVFAGMALGGCQRRAEKKAIPFLNEPEEIVPGRAAWYASTCGGCSAGCGIFAKCRDGRPIKLEGNPQQPMSHGGLCAVGQGSILELYDSQRLKGPTADGKESTWEVVDRQIIGQLAAIRKSGGAVRLLTHTINSPTARRVIGDFLGQFNDARHVMYDPLSASAILDAHQKTHGARILPRYRFDLAEVIVSFDADFLGTWISPVEYTRAYRAGRTLEGSPPKMSLHVQVESGMSLTGSNADLRIVIAPGDIGAAVGQLAMAIAKNLQVKIELAGGGDGPIAQSKIEGLADRLVSARAGKSLVICGQNDLETQLLVNLINQLLGNYGQTLDIASPSQQRLGSDTDLNQLLDELAAGKVAALFMHGVNPAYDLPDSERFVESLKKVGLVVSFAERADETASLVHFICPDRHYLESWNDAEPISGVVSVSQPAIRPPWQTRSFVESLEAWRGKPAEHRQIMQAAWRETIFKRQMVERDFQKFWDRSVEAGFALVDPSSIKLGAFDASAVRSISKRAALARGKLALVLYPKIGMLDGRHAHNPWLHELPDPVTKVTWDNYASLSPATAQRLAINEGDVVRVSVGDRSIELPAQIQPGQHDAVVAIALGYGRRGTDRFSKVGPQWLESNLTVEPGDTIGRNAAPLLAFAGGHLRYSGAEATIAKTGKRHELACTQLHHSIEVPAKLAAGKPRRRPITEETTLAEYAANPNAGSQHEPRRLTLWQDDHSATGHRWGMAIDMTACTGCSACVISCQAENNVPVVGKDEVHRQREMHWLRIDRYYSGEGEDVDVIHQPMLCQQCGNAGCETVCPVLATVHSSEGLNQQVYNRCVGTRYCANNCAYKTRRFNWFAYSREDRLANMVLNPDVTVRSRGVMEKCSFCVQRIQEAKADAKRNGLPVKDGDIQPACQQSCPAHAIVFGDMNDPDSAISKLRQSPRQYRVLEELNVEPSVYYLRLVRNRPRSEEQHHV